MLQLEKEGIKLHKPFPLIQYAVKNKSVLPENLTSQIVENVLCLTFDFQLETLKTKNKQKKEKKEKKGPASPLFSHIEKIICISESRTRKNKYIHR